MKIDFHMHSKFSYDALTKTDALVKQAVNNGIIPTLTDHNTCAGWKEFRASAKKFKSKINLGLELKTYNEGKKMGEIIFYFMNKPILTNELFEAIDEAKKQDCIISVPHPFDRLRLSAFKNVNLIKDDLDAIEVFNSRTRLNYFNKKAKAFAEKYKIPMISGSDAHTPEEIGNAYTTVNASSLEGARKEILKGRTKIWGKKAREFAHFQTQLIKYGLTGYR